MAELKQIDERRRSALSTVAVFGATIAGIGFGALISGRLGDLAWPVLALGIIVHLFGMVGSRRLLNASGYRPAAWELIGYWGCWAIIVVVTCYILWAVIT